MKKSGINQNKHGGIALWHRYQRRRKAWRRSSIEKQRSAKSGNESMA